MKYYKIVDPEGHNGLIYHEELNVDPLPFNPGGDCEPGGIYFAKEDILAFVNYGTELYEIEPIGDVYENPGMPKKYKAHEVNLKYVGKVIDNIEMLIKEGADVHADYDCVLQWAAENGHYNVVRMLLENGADIHADRNYTLRWAVYNGYHKVVELLLENGTDIHAENDYALRWAAYNGRHKVVELLLKHGADIHAENDCSLRWASENGHYKVVKLLIENGADIHAKDDYALRLARYNDDKKMIKLLESYINK